LIILASLTASEMSGAYIGMGIGLGLFSSLFASAGLALLVGTWKECLKSTVWQPSDVICTLFRSAFSVPFIGVPLFMTFSLRNPIILAFGYGVPFIVSLMLRSGFSVRNPCQTQPNGGHPIPVPIEPVEFQHQSPQRGGLPNSDAIYRWLEDIGLTEYHQLLKTQGYDTVADLKTITVSDLKELGITKQMHVKKILSKNGGGMLMANNNEGISPGASPGVYLNAHPNADAKRNDPPLMSVYEELQIPPPAYGSEGRV